MTGKNINESMPEDAIKELKRQGYKGVIAIDFEHDAPAIQEDMAKNIAFAEKQARVLLTRPASTNTR
jgi:tRNA(Ser,Leu) C12 N-acetylase TAN1